MSYKGSKGKIPTDTHQGSTKTEKKNFLHFVFYPEKIFGFFTFFISRFNEKNRQNRGEKPSRFFKNIFVKIKKPKKKKPNDKK